MSNPIRSRTSAASAVVRRASSRVDEVRSSLDHRRLPMVFAPVIAAEACASVAVLAVRYGIWSVAEDGEAERLKARVVTLQQRLPEIHLPASPLAGHMPGRVVALAERVGTTASDLRRRRSA